MSESSSDTESSCGWTVISNDGSDIETLGPKSIVGDDLEEAGGGAAVEQPGSAQGERAELVDESCLDVTLKADEPELDPQVRKGAGLEDHVTLCSSSDHSDIITLADSREAELGAWEEPAAREEEAEETEIGELYLGTSSSSQYTFSAAETMFPAERSVRRSSSSSSTEDEAETKAGALMRRRRPRKNTTGSEPEEQQEEGDEDLEEAEEHREARLNQRQQNSRTLNKCILLALIIAFSMGFGHFYGTVQVQERQRMVQKTRLNELSEIREFHQCQREQDIINKDAVESLREDLEEKQGVVTSLTGIMDKMTKENQNLRAKEAELEVQRRDLLVQLQQAKSERENRQKKLASENQALKSTLEREEASVSAMRDELGRLQAQIRELQEKETGADSVLLENQRLKVHLLEEQNRIQSCLVQKEGLRADTQALQKELYEEKEAMEKLKEELEQVNRRESGAQVDESETEELQARLQELEKKLSFEQQRSDLWERLYVESRDERPKGDKQVKTGRSKGGIMGTVKETFDAVKNSTKEFVHHHKEQIKKAKEAVKENLRKFSDSVKSTFRHLKASTSNVFDNIRRPQEKRNERKDAKEFRPSAEEPWQHHQPPHRHPRKSTADAPFDTRKPGAQKDRRKSAPQGCTGVFDCAYQESMSLFNKAMEPIRADEFHQLLRSYLQREVGHFHHWRELNGFIDSFFHNGLFIHDQMLFTDFVSGVEDYLEEMDEYRSAAGDVFEDLDDYIYRHFFGDTYAQRYGPSRPHQGPTKRECQQHQRKHQHSRPGHPRDRKWARSGRPSDRHFADVKIELGPMPFDPKY